MKFFFFLIPLWLLWLSNGTKGFIFCVMMDFLKRRTVLVAFNWINIFFVFIHTVIRILLAVWTLRKLKIIKGHIKIMQILCQCFFQDKCIIPVFMSLVLEFWRPCARSIKVLKEKNNLLPITGWLFSKTYFNAGCRFNRLHFNNRNFLSGTDLIKIHSTIRVNNEKVEKHEKQFPQHT